MISCLRRERLKVSRLIFVKFDIKINVNMAVVGVTTSISMSVVVLCARKVRAESWTWAKEGQLWFRCSSVCTEIVAWRMFFYVSGYLFLEHPWSCTGFIFKLCLFCPPAFSFVKSIFRACGPFVLVCVTHTNFTEISWLVSYNIFCPSETCIE